MLSYPFPFRDVRVGQGVGWGEEMGMGGSVPTVRHAQGDRLGIRGPLPDLM